jgi:hypothetical protein
VDFRSDIYSFGLILREMLTRNIPAPLAAIVDRCLAKDPAARYGNTADLVRDLRAASVGRKPRWSLIAAALAAIVCRDDAVASTTYSNATDKHQRKDRVSGDPAVAELLARSGAELLRGCDDRRAHRGAVVTAIASRDLANIRRRVSRHEETSARRRS